MTRWTWTAGPAGRLAAAATGLAVTALLAAGLTGAARYAINYWLYRGFPAPAAPHSVQVRVRGGARQVPVVLPSLQLITVRSPALGGFGDPVYVALPPGYARHPRQRYPVLYLLHGFPGEPVQFVNVGQVLTAEATLVAEHRMQPMILVMPTGTKSFLADEEWVNGIRPGNGWETFVAHDLVTTIDARYRTIPSGRGRGIAGLSEGGYAALNIGLHHPGEFTVLESWSGYMKADRMPGIFGHSVQLHRYNSPAIWAPVAAPQLRATHTYIWFYAGAKDYLRRQNRAFNTELTALGVAHRYFLVSGSHNWALWRGLMPQALITASEHLSHG
jgi:enterochelin esterase-like enzyme